MLCLQYIFTGYGVITAAVSVMAVSLAVTSASQQTDQLETSSQVSQRTNNAHAYRTGPLWNAGIRSLDDGDLPPDINQLVKTITQATVPSKRNKKVKTGGGTLQEVRQNPQNAERGR
jgi:predicted secreted protein